MFLGLTERLIVVDCETSSSVDLKKHGSDRYWNSKSTRCLMVSFCEHGSSDVHLYQPHLHQMPKMLVEAAALPPEEVMFAAYNAQFDMKALRLAGIDTPASKWLDLMLVSYVLAFAGPLDDVLKQFEVRDASGQLCRKSPEGKRLIQQFSVRQEPWFDDPDAWSRFAAYCVQDTDVEDRLLAKCLAVLDHPVFHPMMQRLQHQWVLDQRMNAAGIPVSLPTIKGALRIKDLESKRLVAAMKTWTGLSNPNSTQQLHGWLQVLGYQLLNMQAATLREALQDPAMPPVVADVLQARLELAKASTKKFDALERMQVGGRVRNGYTTCGASRTGRTASRGINLSNMERPKIKGPLADSVADLIELGDPDLLKAWLPGKASRLSIMEVLGSSIRGALAAPPGKVINAVDLKSIESVGLAWLAGCDTVLDLFFEGRDTYKDFATRYYNIDYESVTSEQRTFCKAPVLGCGYSASGPALVAYAAGMGITMTEEEADKAVAVFRGMYAEIPLFWRNLENAAKQAIANPGREFRVHACDTLVDGLATYKPWPYISYYKGGDFLYCGLPSGRTLFYYKPEVLAVRRTSRRTGEPYWANSIHYWGKRQDAGGAWQFITTHAGSLAENITQAVCRDILYHGLELTHQDPDIEVVGSTYDEVITLCDADKGPDAYQRMIQYMTTRPPWADDRFFLGADGYHSAKRYRK